MFRIVFFASTLIAFTNSQSNSCTTPNGQSAQCISIYSCTILYNAVTTRNSQQILFLRESQCGYDQEPLVCCGSDDNYKTKPNNPQGGSRRRVNNKTENGNRRNGGSEGNGGNGEFYGNGGNRRGSGNNRRGSANVLPDRSTCGYQNADRILDGQITGLDEFPWMALLQYRKSSGSLVYSCGGTLISSRYVLTAAHCVTGKILTKVGKLVTVRLGEWNTDTEDDCINQQGFQICSDPPVDVGVEETIPHSEYSDSSTNRYYDIGLVRLKNEVPFTQFITPICLPTSSERSPVNTRLTVAGWGRTEYSNSSPVKLKLKVPVKSPSQCSNKFRTAGVSVSDTQLCAGGERGRDSCNGDSGGPLMAPAGNKSGQFYIEGIVSFGAKCGSDGWPGIYTRVSEYVDWIENNVRA